MTMMMIGTISRNHQRQKYFNKLILTVNRLKQIFYVYSTRHKVQRYVKPILISITSLCTNIDSNIWISKKTSQVYLRIQYDSTFNEAILETSINREMYHARNFLFVCQLPVISKDQIYLSKKYK